MSVYKANVDLSDLFHDMSYNYQKSFLVEEFCCETFDKAKEMLDKK